VSRLLEALHRGDDARVAELLAANPDRTIDSARLNGDERLERLLES
jgi:hypothetical protein